MKKSILRVALVFISSSIVLPPSCLPPARAQSGLPQAQVDAIDKWARVIRKCQTSKVMYEVTGLLKQTIAQVEAKKDERNIHLVGALRGMQQAAKLRARGLKKRDQKLLNAAESIISTNVAMMHGRAVF